MDLSRYWKPVFDTLNDGLMVVDAKGVIIAVNPAAEKITGYAGDELVGKSCRVLNCTGCHIQDDNPNTWCRLFDRGSSKDKKCNIINKDNRIVHIRKSATVLKDKSGQVIGAVEVLTDITESVRQQQKIEVMRNSMGLEDGYHDLLGVSEAMRRMFALIENVAQSDAPVMIQGQSGTGKELVAMAIHEVSPRREKSFIKVNCAALNENLLESELFGHVKGAFTGAERMRIGRFEAAHEGTLFLDEIGDIPPQTQVKLLRVLESGIIERVGDHRPIPVDVRIVTATNKDLDTLIVTDRFREDLFFRINVFPIHCPSLSERMEDIPLLVENFIAHGLRKSRKKITGISSEALDRLMHYPWPGNVRELRNVIEYAMVLCHEGDIGIDHLPSKIIDSENGEKDHASRTWKSHSPDRTALIQALARCNGNQSEAARLMGVSRVTIWKWIRKYGIDPDAIRKK
ncbi:MAG: sigma 54-interacting transcriptional regulator [Thermodesulfobacteriota bacterium]